MWWKNGTKKRKNVPHKHKNNIIVKIVKISNRYNIKNYEYTKNKKWNILYRNENMIDKWGEIVYYDKCKKNKIEGVYMYEMGNC